MKSYAISNADRKRVERFARRQADELSQTHIKLILKLVALELYKIHGFGKVRFARVLRALTADLGEIGEEYGLDCTMVKLDDELRKIGIVDEKGEWNFGD